MTSEIELIEKVHLLTEKVFFNLPTDELHEMKKILLKHMKNHITSIKIDDLEKILTQVYKLTDLFNYYLHLFHNKKIKEEDYQNLLIILLESVFSEVEETKSYFTLCENKNTICFSNYFLYIASSKAENYKESFFIRHILKKDVINGFFKILKACQPNPYDEGFLIIGFAYYFKNEAYRNQLKEIFNYSLFD